jgi:hypothetical protein
MRTRWLWAAAGLALLVGPAWAQERGGVRKNPPGPKAERDCDCCPKPPRPPQPPGAGEGRERPPGPPPAGEGRERPPCDHVCPHHPPVRPPLPPPRPGAEGRPPQRPGAEGRPPQPPPARPECSCECHKASRPPGGERPRGNNGLGNGQDPAPPGQPRENDGPGTRPGAPGNRRGGDR